MRRTLMLDEDDLIMVVKEDIVKQIDNNRGEMNRTEFVNHLIQCQLKDYYEHEEYVAKEEFQRYTRKIMELLYNFLQFFISYGMAMGGGNQQEDIRHLSSQLESFYKTDEETDGA